MLFRSDARPCGTGSGDTPVEEEETPVLTSIALDAEALTLSVGGQKSLSVTGSYSDGSSSSISVFASVESSDETVAIPSVENGTVLVTARGAGTASITLTASDGITASCSVTVTLAGSGNISAESGVLTLALSDTELYRNYGEISFTASDGGSLVSSSDLTWEAKLLYKGDEVNKKYGTDFYTVSGSSLSVNASKPLPAGNYQLYVTAERTVGDGLSVTSGSTFDITVKDAYYYEFDLASISFNRTSGADGYYKDDNLALALQEIKAYNGKAIIKLSGEGSDYTEATENDPASGTFYDINMSFYYNEIGNSTVALDCSEVTNLTKLAGLTNGAYLRIRELTLPDTITLIAGENNMPLLTALTLPAAVTEIEASAFTSFYALTSVTFTNTSGWTATSSDGGSATEIDVTDDKTNATNLVSGDWSSVSLKCDN